jgi:hypothetical protein
VKTAFPLLAVALAASFWVARAADTQAGEDPIALLLREREALTGEKSEASPEVFNGLLKITADFTGLSHDQALALVNTTLSQDGILRIKQPDGTFRAELSQGNKINQPAGFPSTPATEPKVSVMQLTNAPLDGVLMNLLRYSGKKLVVSAALLKDKSINLYVANLTQSQAAGILRDALRQQAGLLLDEFPGDTLQARQDESFVAADRVLGAVYLHDVTAGRILGALYNVTRKSVVIPDGNSALVTVGFSYRSKKEAENLLRTALAAQAGIVLDDRPDGSLSLHQPERNETFAEPAAAPKP